MIRDFGEAARRSDAVFHQMMTLDVGYASAEVLSHRERHYPEPIRAVAAAEIERRERMEAE